jgi:hypothetical protein
MSRPERVRALVGAAVLVAGLGTLAACGGGDDKTGVADHRVSADAGSTSSAGTEASATPTVPTATQGLPEGFPVDDVPLLDEKVLTGSAGGPDGEFAWSVVLQSSRAVSELSAEVHKEFTAAGYTAGPASEVGDLSVMKFTGPKYEVGVTAARSDDMVAVTYVVRDLG